MANVGHGTARQIIDNDGDVADVTDNRLDVNATVGVGSSTLTTYAQFAVEAGGETLTAGLGVSAVTTCKEIIFQADFDNTAYIMVGDSGVVADTEGIRLHAGDTLVLPVSSTDNVSVRASTTSQNLNVAIIT